MRRLLTVLLLTCACAGIFSSPALAHNVLVGSDPKDGATLSAAPGRVTLVFDQVVRQGYAQVRVTGAEGSAWADGAAVVAAERVSVEVRPLPAGGSYVVGYRVLSADGHPVTGRITFHLTATATPFQGSSGTSSGAPSETVSEAGSEAGSPGADGTSSEAPSPGSGAASPGAPAQGSTADAAETAAQGTGADAAEGPAQGSGADAAEAAAQGSSVDAAEAAANGGAGMAVVWIVGA
ncbi:copper resistance protein CopC, partial [Nonomuraea sp. K274]